MHILRTYYQIQLCLDLLKADLRSLMLWMNNVTKRRMIFLRRIRAQVIHEVVRVAVLALSCV
jgi:hypothetical protein